MKLSEISRPLNMVLNLYVYYVNCVSALLHYTGQKSIGILLKMYPKIIKEFLISDDFHMHQKYNHFFVGKYP